MNKDERLRESCFGIHEGDADDNIWRPVTKSLGSQSLEAWRASDKFSVKEGLDELAKIDSSKQAESFGKVRKKNAGSTKRYHRRNRSRWLRECADYGHGISILSMLSDMTEDVPSNGAIQNASVTKIIYKDGKFTVNSVASTEYLEVGEK